MISFSRCAKWQCQSCAGISPETYSFLSNREDFAWYCPSCKVPAAEDVLNGVQIEEKCQQFFETISIRLLNVEQGLILKADKARVEGMESKVLVVQNSVQMIATDISKLNSKFQLLRTEQLEVAKRIKNIVIRGAPESTKLEDQDLVQEVFADIGCPDIEIESVIRLGRIDNRQPDSDARPKTRPIRVILTNESDKAPIIRNAPKIRQSQSTLYSPTSILIVPDQTKLEREQDIELRKNLRAARERDPGSRYSIRSGKVVKLPNLRPPQTPVLL